MNYPLNNVLLISLSILFGVAMIYEGFLIVKLHKQIVPLPSRLLYWIGVGLIGKEKSTQRFTGKNTPQNLRTYAIFVLVLGTCLLISCFINIIW